MKSSKKYFHNAQNLILVAPLIILFSISGCIEKQKEYRVSISLMEPETKITTEKVINIKASSDSAAFKSACNQYWAQKASVLEVNKRFEGTPGYPPMAIPFYFSVESKDGRTINFPKEEAERLTFETVNYFQTKVLPGIDTITPLIKKPKTEPAKIY